MEEKLKKLDLKSCLKSLNYQIKDKKIITILSNYFIYYISIFIIIILLSIYLIISIIFILSIII